MAGISDWGPVRGELLLTLMDHVIFDTETGCWLLVSVFLEEEVDFRWLAWALWYHMSEPLHVYLDKPWCSSAQFGICVNPVHSTALDLVYTRVPAEAVA